jgi:O-antigen/teichoic acid export membrane protein
MLGYLRRLATTGAAYTASSVLSKLIAVVLLPLYTAYLTPADYGAAEVMIATVVAASIVVRLGLIEALLRFYYMTDVPPASPASPPAAAGSAAGTDFQRRVVSTGFAALFWTTTAGALIGLALAEPLSDALLGHPDAELGRLAVLGLWTLTLWEYALTLLRVDERARAYFTITVLNVVATIPVTAWLIAVEDQGAAGILIGSFATGAVFLVGLLWTQRRRLSFRFDRELLRRMMRFGLPTMPAELSLYSLNFIDRILIARLAGLAEAGLYALAIKFAQGMNVIARAFQLAWPPLAYSIADDDEARRAYSLVFTWFATLCAGAVASVWLLAPWLVALLAAPEFARAQEAVGPLSAGVALYALYLVLVVILGRTGRTEFNLPATAAGTVVNVVANLILIPAYGIVGAAVALVLSYVVVLALMYVLTQRLFPVPYEWRRLSLLLVATALAVAVGDSLVADEGAGALLLRLVILAAIPAGLLAAGFLTPEERDGLRRLPGLAKERLAAIGETPADARTPDDRGYAPEVFEQAARDEDRGAT